MMGISGKRKRKAWRFMDAVGEDMSVVEVTEEDAEFQMMEQNGD